MFWFLVVHVSSMRSLHERGLSVGRAQIRFFGTVFPA